MEVRKRVWVVLAIDIGAVGAVGTAARTEYHLLLRDIVILMSTIRNSGSAEIYLRRTCSCQEIIIMSTISERWEATEIDPARVAMPVRVLMTSRSRFESAFARDVASLLRISARRVLVGQIVAGSVVVGFSIRAPGVSILDAVHFG